MKSWQQYKAEPARQIDPSDSMQIDRKEYEMIQADARYGKPWRDCVGDGLILALASDLDEERKLNARTPPTGIDLEVCSDIQKRQQIGIKKNGVTVADAKLTHNQWLEHAYQEALDFAIYLKRAQQPYSPTCETDSPSSAVCSLGTFGCGLKHESPTWVKDAAEEIVEELFGEIGTEQSIPVVEQILKRHANL